MGFYKGLSMKGKNSKLNNLRRRLLRNEFIVVIFTYIMMKLLTGFRLCFIIDISWYASRGSTDLVECGDLH